MKNYPDIIAYSSMWQDRELLKVDTLRRISIVKGGQQTANTEVIATNAPVCNSVNMHMW